jgi:hypothetical protein
MRTTETPMLIATNSSDKFTITMGPINVMFFFLVFFVTADLFKAVQLLEMSFFYPLFSGSVLIGLQYFLKLLPTKGVILKI